MLMNNNERLNRVAEALRKSDWMNWDAKAAAAVALRAAGVEEMAREIEYFRVSASQLKWMGDLPSEERTRLIGLYFGDFAEAQKQLAEARTALARTLDWLEDEIGGAQMMAPDCGGRFRREAEPQVVFNEAIAEALNLVRQARAVLGERKEGI